MCVVRPVIAQLTIADGVSGGTIIPLTDDEYLVGRQRVLDLHELRHVLPRRQAEVDAALQVAERKIAAAARQIVKCRNQIWIEPARRRHGDGRAAAIAQLIEAPPVDDPVAG